MALHPDAELGRDPVAAARFVDDAAAFDELLEEVLPAPFYALDTEFHRERTYYARLALVQLAWPGGIALIDPLAVDVARLSELFAGDGVAVLHACDQDLEIFERACGRVPARLFDTQIAAGFVGMSSPSLGNLVDKLLGIRLEKGDQLTDWMHRPLTASQLHYGASDVAHLLDLYEVLHQRLEATGRWQWAVEECATVLSRTRRSTDPQEAWWKLRQARQLHGKARGVAQEVAAWRERKARQVDQPLRTVLSDLAIGSIAHHPPATRAELDAVRSLDGRRVSGALAEELIEAVQAGLRLASSELRLPPVPQGESVAKPAVALAVAWMQERARELEIDAAILATRADIMGFLKDPPEGRLATSWRYELVGEPIRSLVEGTAALAVSGSNLVLEQRSRIPFSPVAD